MSRFFQVLEGGGIATRGTELTGIGKTFKYLMNLGNKPIKTQLHLYLVTIKRLKPEAYIYFFKVGSQIPNLELLPEDSRD
jgi:hypothetical protein